MSRQNENPAKSAASHLMRRRIVRWLSACFRVPSSRSNSQSRIKPPLCFVPTPATPLRNKSVLHIHHDALEFPDGEIVLRTRRKRPSGDTATEKGDEFPPPHGAYPKAKDHGLSIANPGAGSGPGIKAKSLPYLLTDSGQFDILLFGPGWRGSDAIRSTTSARGRHAARRRGGCVAACGARAAAQTLEALDIF